MLGFDAEDEHLPRVADFYLGKSVFITGASGFVGSVLLETLLRCCPGIKAIYILLRAKKNLSPEERKEQIFNKRLFKSLKEKNQEMLKKVHVIEGEISLKNLGMRPEDEQLILEEVSVIFHCAAFISFTKPLGLILSNNVLSVSSVIELCRKMKKIECLVYTSTAYSNCNHTNIILEEQIYRLPFRAEKFLLALKNKDDEKLQQLFEHCKPEWPNTYTFSKCLAENVIMDTASDLPIAIIRPSMVFSTWKHPIPGYDEGNSLATALLILYLKGFVTVGYGDPNCKLNLVPADIVANAHILAACCVGTKRHNSPKIFHCTSTENLQVTFSEYTKSGKKLSHNFHIPKSFADSTNFFLVRNRYLYYVFATYHHYLHAIVFDGILKIFGNESSVCSSYFLFEKMMKCCRLFLFSTFEFERKNIECLEKLMNTEDKKKLPLDFEDATLMEILWKIPEVSPFYDWKIDSKTSLERKKKSYWCRILIKGTQWTFHIILILLLYQFFLLFY